MNDEVINFFRTTDEHGYMSNFYPASITHRGVFYKTSEHFYQAMKPTDPVERAMVVAAKTPKEAKEVANSCHSIRKDWHDVKYNVMMFVVWQKFLQNVNLREKLIMTGDAELVEYSPYDSYWGSGKDGLGENNLGEILKSVRAIFSGFESVYNANFIEEDIILPKALQ